MSDDDQARQLRHMGLLLQDDRGAYEALLMLRFPDITWRRPLPISAGGREGLACRLCIARNGFRASDGELFEDIVVFAHHLIEKHPLV